jgi:hypothetical protein
MKRRIGYYLAAAALAAAGIAGAVNAGATPILARGQPMDEPQFDRAMTVTSGLEIISGNDRATAAAPDHQVLAGFNTRAGGTEIAVGFNSTKVGTEIAY